MNMKESRVEQWKRKLLDLSKRNPLLNVRDSAKFLPLEDGVSFLGGGATSAVVPYVPPEAGAVVPYKSRLSEKEIRKRLKELYTTSRSIFMESGINSLYVVVGFLNWNEEDGGEFYRAPLALIPAQLVRQTAAPGFKLVRTDEDASVNFCLVEMMRSLFGIPVKDVPGGGLDDGDPDIGEVFRVFADAIRNLKEWSISTDIALGIFSFSKIVIWKDLNDHFEEFRLHPFVAHLAERKGLFDDRISVFPQEEVERHIHPERLFCPLSADSSQLAAVLYSEFGKSFVLHGPPGTGKSQTITNIIAHNLVLGKRILFVSEKKAALDVVHKRLTDVGLAPFCLELHSNKADKANVMRQFKAALEVAVSLEAEHWSETCANLEAGHKELAVYVQELHKRCPNGMNAHDCIAKYGFRSPCASGRLIAFDVAACTSESLGGVRETLSKVINEWRCVNREAFAAFRNMLKAKVWSLQFQMRVERQVGEYLAILSDDNCVRRLGRLVWKSLLMVFSGTIRFPIFASRKEQMERMISMHHANPTHIQIAPYPIQYQLLGGEAKQLVPVDLRAQKVQDLLQAMNILDFSQMQGQGGPPPNLRFFEKVWGIHINTLNHWGQWLCDARTALLKSTPVDFSLVKSSIYENDMTMEYKVKLAMGGMISMDTGLRALGIDYDLEQTKMRDEQQRAAEIAADDEEDNARAEELKASMYSPQPGTTKLMAAQQPPGGGAPAPAPGGAVPPTGGGGGQAADINALWDQAQQMASQIISEPPEQRRSDLINLSKTNPELHSFVKTCIDQMENQAATQGKAMARQGQM